MLGVGISMSIEAYDEENMQGRNFWDEKSKKVCFQIVQVL